MASDDEKTILAVIRQLCLVGISASRMPALRKKTCDIVGRAGQAIYYVEVKQRFGPEPGTYTLRRGARSADYSVIEQATKQLLAMPEQEHVYRVIWIVIEDDDDDAMQLTTLVHTLYGIQRLSLGRGDMEIKVDCFTT